MNKELLLVAESLSDVKGVDREVVLEAIQSALEKATRNQFGDIGVRVELDPKTGEYKTFRLWEIVADEDFINADREIALSEALKTYPDVSEGDFIEEPMESVAFGRIAAQTAKQVIAQKVREAGRNIILNQMRERLGTLITGTVKRTTSSMIIVDLGGNAEAILPRTEILPHENFRTNDHVLGVLCEVKADARGAQLIMSRTRPEVLIELFRREVPEISEEVIIIKSAARDPGVRAKIAVKTNDGRIDPIGACVGMRGSRVQAVSSELGGERVDIVLWDDNPAQLVINAMSPAEVRSIVVDEDTHTMDIAVAEEHLSQAIGRSGQNVRLASELTGWTLNVMSETDFENKTKEESKDLITLFVTELDVDEELAQVLINAGFSSLEEIAYVPVDEFLSIDAFDEDLVYELRNRANDVLLTKALAVEEILDNAHPADDLLNMKGMTEPLARLLASKGIVAMEDLAECAVDEVIEMTNISEEEAAALIMTAREPWFAND